MSRPALLGLALLLVASGCHAVTYESQRSWEQPAWTPERPALQLSEEQRARALEKHRVRAAARHEEALDVAREARGDTAAVASAVIACFDLGDRDVAEQLADGSRGVYTWENAGKAATIECRYRSRGWAEGGALEIHVQRGTAQGLLAIAFPPGTYGVAADGEHWTRPEDDQRYGTWPSQQDLACLRAPVIELAANENEATYEVPIACASFRAGPPQGDQLYALRRFEKDSAADRLLVSLCAREHTSEPEAQLAIWLARNDISWDEYVEHGGAYGNLLTFGTTRRILPRHANGAAKLLVESGTDPARTHFFGGDGVETPLADEAAPATPEPEKPAPNATP